MDGNNKQPKKAYIREPVVINRKMSLRREKHLSMYIIAKATITLSKMKFKLHILVRKTLVFLLLVHITVRAKKAIWWRKSYRSY